MTINSDHVLAVAAGFGAGCIAYGGSIVLNGEYHRLGDADRGWIGLGVAILVYALVTLWQRRTP
jgi:zinc transporter ZupT